MTGPARRVKSLSSSSTLYRYPLESSEANLSCTFQKPSSVTLGYNTDKKELFYYNPSESTYSGNIAKYVSAGSSVKATSGYEYVFRAYPVDTVQVDELIGVNIFDVVSEGTSMYNMNSSSFAVSFNAYPVKFNSYDVQILSDTSTHPSFNVVYDKNGIITKASLQSGSYLYFWSDNANIASTTEKTISAEIEFALVSPSQGGHVKIADNYSKIV